MTIPDRYRNGAGGWREQHGHARTSPVNETGAPMKSAPVDFRESIQLLPRVSFSIGNPEFDQQRIQQRVVQSEHVGDRVGFAEDRLGFIRGFVLQTGQVLGQSAVVQIETAKPATEPRRNRRQRGQLAARRDDQGRRDPRVAAGRRGRRRHDLGSKRSGGVAIGRPGLFGRSGHVPSHVRICGFDGGGSASNGGDAP